MGLTCVVSAPLLLQLACLRCTSLLQAYQPTSSPIKDSTAGMNVGNQMAVTCCWDRPHLSCCFLCYLLMWKLLNCLGFLAASSVAGLLMTQCLGLLWLEHLLCSLLLALVLAALVYFVIFLFGDEGLAVSSFCLLAIFLPVLCLDCLLKLMMRYCLGILFYPLCLHTHLSLCWTLSTSVPSMHTVLWCSLLGKWGWYCRCPFYKMLSVPVQMLT